MTKEEMIKLRTSGATLKDIADKAGVSIRTVHAKTGGRQGRPKNKSHQRTKRNQDRDNHIREMIASGKWKQKDAVREYGLTRQRVSQIVKGG